MIELREKLNFTNNKLAQKKVTMIAKKYLPEVILVTFLIQHLFSSTRF